MPYKNLGGQGCSFGRRKSSAVRPVWCGIRLVVGCLLVLMVISACATTKATKLDKGVWLLIEAGYDADVSPDGKTLVYTESIKGRPWKEDLVFYSMESGERDRTIPNGFWDGEARFSPDGRQLCFTTQMGSFRNLSLLDLTTNSVKEMTYAGAWHPSWAPDSRRIAFVSDQSGHSELWTYDLESLMFRQLTFFEGEVATPAWSPDDSCIVFCRLIDGQWDLWMVPREGGEGVPLFETTQNECYPRWSRSGKLLAFCSFRQQGENALKSSTIWIMKRKSGTCSGDVVEVMTARQDKEKLFYPVFSPDETKLFFSTNQASFRWDIGVFDLKKNDTLTK